MQYRPRRSLLFIYRRISHKSFMFFVKIYLEKFKNHYINELVIHKTFTLLI